MQSVDFTMPGLCVRVSSVSALNADESMYDIGARLDRSQSLHAGDAMSPTLMYLENNTDMALPSRRPILALWSWSTGQLVVVACGAERGVFATLLDVSVILFLTVPAASFVRTSCQYAGLEADARDTYWSYTVFFLGDGQEKV